MTTTQISFQTTTGYMTVAVSPGSITLVAGPNGVGKSALLEAIYRSLASGVGTYLPGHRQIYFNSGWEQVGMDATQLYLNQYQSRDAFSRFKSAWAEDQFKVIIRTMLHQEAAYNREFRKNTAAGLYENDESAKLLASPVDTLNIIFESAGLPVRFSLGDLGIMATRGDSEYSIEALSDGERAALFIVAAIINQKDDAVIIIDEPEKHLHPSITSLLIEACLRAKPEISFIFASHDVSLIENLNVDQIFHVRDSKVVTTKPESRIFDIETLEGIDEIAEDLKRDLLGVRSKLLLVEGSFTSHDLSLYGLVYPGVKISPKGGYQKVCDSVKVLKDMLSEHRLDAYGLIDGDGRDAAERITLQESGIFIIPTPTIENLFFRSEMVACFIDAKGSFDGLDEAGAVKKLEAACVETALTERDDIVQKRVSWSLERKLNGLKMSPKQIKSRDHDEITISISDIEDDISKSVDMIIGRKDWQQIITTLPIKNTKLPHAASTALGAQNFAHYRDVVLRQIELATPKGIAAIESLRRDMPALPISG